MYKSIGFACNRRRQNTSESFTFTVYEFQMFYFAKWIV